MKYIKFKSICIFLNGSCFFNKNNFIKNKLFEVLENNLKNFELAKVELKNFSSQKTKYVTYK